MHVIFCLLSVAAVSNTPSGHTSPRHHRVASRIPAQSYAGASGMVDIHRAPAALAFTVKRGASVQSVLGALGDIVPQRIGQRTWLVEAGPRGSKVKSLLQNSSIVERWLTSYRTEQSGTLRIATGSIRVRFNAPSNRRQILGLVNQAKATMVREIHGPQGVFEVQAASPDATVETAMALNLQASVLWAIPDFFYRKRVDFIPDDPLFDDQWHHALIGSTGAWESGLGLTDIIIAIVDSGVEITHPDFADRIVSPRDALDEDNNPTPGEDEAHGTAAAGLAAAIGNNALGVAGVCGGCSIMPIRLLSDGGWGRYGADSDAFRWAADHGAHIISSSWGFSEATSIPSNLESAIRYAADEGRGGLGSLVIFATGNEYRENESYELSSHPMVIGVGASSYFDVRENYSNWGDEIDVVAPAGSVTTDMLGDSGYYFGDYTFDFGGTSAAAPVAAGVAGLIFSADTTLTRGQAQGVLASTADQIGEVTYTDEHHPHYGRGRVNALRAVQMASGGEVCQPTAEVCDNGLDDDCDWLVDDLDPNCVPDITEVGVACEFDYQCGAVGFCLPNQYGYPGGYCSLSCEGSCDDGNVCVEGRRNDWCFDGCESRDDCRTGYDCLRYTNSSKVCAPSCTVNGCGNGETCNRQSGDCEHDGPTGIGGACNDSVQCADNGMCLRESWAGLPGGYCSNSCGAGSTCAPGATCVDLGQPACLATCTRNEHCREGYACWPSNEEGTEGICWPVCESSEDCDGESCNDLGLCGDDTPPEGDPVGDDTNLFEADSCACDLTYACDDACACDIECKDGCAAMTPTESPQGPVWAALVLILGQHRRRRARL